ncbi:DUF3093 domain-containing protein [Arthrobacter sp. 260]|uniref:DUF3093 domain-containing protein n=1 Tax=Arthrobacter sp. 260 TaxID=2735314 RepID=UPI00149100AF|nr:DUF3093 domain-containing protein [Arthrobacter sp. 260]NOJ60931.1 DUF3093 domain-containing protein [Arthrobacter sp. 260]
MQKRSSSAAKEPILYKESLRPNIWIWILATGLSSFGAIAFAPINPTVGVISSIATFLALGTTLILFTPKIIVTPTTVRVGRARIERTFVGTVTAYTGQDATHQRGPAMNGLAYLCIRGWISAVVKIEITDDQDRTPYWLTSSRHPEELATILSTPV